MKILFVGSIPPIKDGIADHNYFLLKELFKQKNLKVFVLPSVESRDYSSIDLPADAILDYNNFLQNDYDLVHFQFGNSYQGSYIFHIYNLLSKKNIKTIITFHDLATTSFAKIVRTLVAKPSYLKYELGRPSIPQMLEKADQVIVYSDFIKNKFDKNSHKKIHIFRMGSTEFVVNKKDAREKFGFKEKECIITSFGFITPRKGYEDVIYAISRLLKQGLNIKYYIIGNFNFLHYKLYLHYLVRKLKVKENVIFTGYLDIKKTRNILSASDIIIQPRKYSTEGASFSLTTGMFAKTPIITIKTGGMSEYIKNKETGLLINHDTTSYENAIQTLAKDKKLREKLGANAYIWAVNNISWNKIAEEHKKLYSSVNKIR